MKNVIYIYSNGFRKHFTSESLFYSLSLPLFLSFPLLSLPVLVLVLVLLVVVSLMRYEWYADDPLTTHNGQRQQTFKFLNPSDAFYVIRGATQDIHNSRRLYL